MKYFKIKSFIRILFPKKIWDFLSILKKLIKFYKNTEITGKYCRKISRQNKKNQITIVFIVYMPEVFASFESIYETALENEKFSVYLLAQPHVENQQGIMGQNPAYTYLKEKYSGINVINAYENGNWFELKSLAPDYVFYTRPYCHQYYSLYDPVNVREYAKICFHPYCYDMDKTADFYIIYNFKFLANVALLFNCTDSTSKKLKKITKPVIFKNKYPKINNTGFSRFDLLNSAFIKNNNVKKNVLWLPRWTSDVDISNGAKKGNFLKYFENFFHYAELHRDIDFTIRPHPLMFANYMELGILTKTQIEIIFKRCKELGNIYIDTEKNYMNSLVKADLLIADYTGLLIEYFISGRPIIYCDDASTFNKEAKLMDKTLYHVSDWCEIEICLNNILENNNDELYEDRLKVLPLFVKENNVGKKIIDIITEDYYGR